MIGEAIANALKEMMEEKDQPIKGPYFPMNEAARKAHEEHQAYVLENWPKLKEAELTMIKLKNRMDEERAEWALKVRAAQPELNDCHGFEINDDNTQVCIFYETEEKRDAAAETRTGTTGGDAAQPSWAKGVGVSSKPN